MVFLTTSWVILNVSRYRNRSKYTQTRSPISAFVGWSQWATCGLKVVKRTDIIGLKSTMKFGKIDIIVLNINGISGIYSNGDCFTEITIMNKNNIVLWIWIMLYPYSLHVGIDLVKW